MFKMEIKYKYVKEKEFTVIFDINPNLNYVKWRCAFCGQKTNLILVDEICVDEIICGSKTLTAKSLKIGVENKLRKILKIKKRKSCDKQSCTERHMKALVKIIAAEKVLEYN